MATTKKKSSAQLFGLLRSAPPDTYYQIVDFLEEKVCKPTSTNLQEIGDKTLARHLNALLNGEGAFWPSSTRSRKASQSSTLKRELNPFGIGDASMPGQWHNALDALERFVNAKTVPDGSKNRRMRVGEALHFFQWCKLDGLTPNETITVLVPWLLSDNAEPPAELLAAFMKSLAYHFRVRVGDEDWQERHDVFAKTWFSANGPEVAQILQTGRPLPEHAAVYLEVLECAEVFVQGDWSKAEALARAAFPASYTFS